MGGGIDVDSKGILWSSANIGAIRLDPNTGQYTDYKSILPGGSPYGVTVDAEHLVGAGGGPKIARSSK